VAAAVTEIQLLAVPELRELQIRAAAAAVVVATLGMVATAAPASS